MIKLFKGEFDITRWMGPEQARELELDQIHLFFQAFIHTGLKPVTERWHPRGCITGLKPGVNES